MKIITELILKCLKYYHRQKYLYLFKKEEYIKAYDLLKYVLVHDKPIDQGAANMMCAKLEFLAYDNFQKAREYLDEAYYTWKYNFKASDYGFYGHILCNLGEHDKGIEYIEKSIEMEPDEDNLSYYAAALSNDQDKRSIGIRKRIIEIDPGNCINRAYLAMDLFETGQKEEAFLEAKQAEKYAHDLDDYFQCGSMYERLEDFQKALDFYKKCEKLHYTPEFKLYYFIAECYYNMQNFGEAISYAIKSLQLNYDYSVAKNLLLVVTEISESEINLDQFINEHEGTCLVYIIRALQSFRNKKHVDTDSYLSKAEQLSPSLDELHYIGKLYEKTGNKAAALKIFNECEQKSYWNKRGLYESIINYYLHLEDYTSAIRYSIKSLYFYFNDDEAKRVLLSISKELKDDYNLDEITDKYPETCLSYIILAKKSVKQKDMPKARELADKAFQLNPSLAESFFIADIYYDIGEFRKAIEIFKECEKLDFKDKVLLYLSLANCFGKLKEINNSIAYADKVLSVEPDNKNAKEIINACKEQAGEAH
jgi:tetratricopeptide (TPR) repeat protein